MKTSQIHILRTEKATKFGGALSAGLPFRSRCLAWWNLTSIIEPLPFQLYGDVKIEARRNYLALVIASESLPDSDDGLVTSTRETSIVQYRVSVNVEEISFSDNTFASALLPV